MKHMCGAHCMDDSTDRLVLMTVIQERRRWRVYVCSDTIQENPDSSLEQGRCYVKFKVESRVDPKKTDELVAAGKKWVCGLERQLTLKGR